MTDVKGVLLSLPVVAVALGALTAGLVELGRYLRLGELTLALLAIPIALALAYLAWYRTLPYEPPAAPSGPGSSRALGISSEEPFEDPVEEADRFDREAAPPPRGGAAPAVVEDGTEPGSTAPR